MPRTSVRLVLCICAMATPLACAAGAASGGAKSADTATSASAAPAASPATTDAGPATTTTAVDEKGDEKPTKLAETHAAPASSSSASGGGADAGASEGRGKEPGRGPADLRAMVAAHRDEARACYDKGLVDHPGMEGDLVIQWLIDPKGKVSHVSLDSTRSQITDAAVAACIGAVIGKLQFAPSPGGYETRASYPFNFHPHHAGHGTSP
jgi:hypothetical protein